jgi:hypothetical protein
MHNLQGQKMGDRYQDQCSRQRMYSERSYPEVKKEEGPPVGAKIARQRC